VGRYESRSDMGVIDGVYGVTSGESSGVPVGLISEGFRSFNTSTGSCLTLVSCFLCRFRYPDTPPWNQETCRHPARKSDAAGTHDPPTIAREDGRKQSMRSTALYSIRIRKKEERNRKSFRMEGKRFDNARSRVGIWMLAFFQADDHEELSLPPLRRMLGRWVIVWTRGSIPLGQCRPFH
jgi:hypothetical protein